MSKTKAERDAEFYDRERRAWTQFTQALANVRSHAEALRFVNAAAAPTGAQPGAKFYGNLGYFLGTFGVPEASSVDERRLYIALAERIRAGLQPENAVGLKQCNDAIAQLEASIKGKGG